ncbi:WYL domain-containing protein [Nocardioidaceae bacterium]|nr:WYL domain-containing protein [Nocardioidaceae bacterium]
MPPPKYVQRFARLPRLLQLLTEHPDGLSLADLAQVAGGTPAEVREDLLAFYTADVGGSDLMGLSRPEVIEFLGVDGAEADPNAAEVVRVATDRPTDELGIELLDPAELALLYTAARDLQDLEPDDADLASAVEALAATVYGEPNRTQPHRVFDTALEPIRQGREGRKRVRIQYSRAWHPGLSERVIEPYRLQRTRRGWEVDAGPPDEDGALRTFLLGHVRDAELLEETFEEPSGLVRMLEEQRRTTTVRVSIAHAGRWTADRYAEHVTVVDDRQDHVVLDLDMLEPVGDRLGLMLLSTGEPFEVLSPHSLRDAAADLAGRLLERWEPRTT